MKSPSLSFYRDGLFISRKAMGIDPVPVMAMVSE
jgi:hypothetical protein